MNRRQSVFLICLLTLSLLIVSHALAKKDNCPEGYQKVPFAKLQSNLAEYEGCQVEFEAQFAMVLPAMMVEMQKKSLPKEYRNFAAYFSFVGTMGSAGVPKGKDGPVWELKAGDKIRIKGTASSGAAKAESRWGVSSDAGTLFVAVDEIENLGSGTAAIPAASDSGSSDDIAAKLKKLKDMLDQGLISQEEYEAKKKELLSNM